MIKQAPTLGRMAAMVLFAMSCFGLLLFLWVTFGGSLPLRPEAYRFEVAFSEAATLAQEADVRMAGVNIGKVKTKELADDGSARTLAELEIKSDFAPIPKDTRAILRQKTLLGETYVELSPGDPEGGTLGEGEQLPSGQVESAVQLDEIFNAFDKPTQRAGREWVDELAKAIEGRSDDLNAAFGNLEGLAVDGNELLQVLDEQDEAVHRLIKNTGVVFGAINEQQGQLRDLIGNAKNTFEATASRDEALRQTFQIFPTFLDESRATLVRLEDFSRDTRPLVNDLKGPADNLGPTVRDLGDLAPDLEGLFRDLDPLIRVSRTGLPALRQVVDGASPVFTSARMFLPELNPILAFFNFQQAKIAGFLSGGAFNLAGDFGGERYQVQVGMFDPRSFERFTERPPWDRGSAYQLPNGLSRTLALGGYESIDCSNAGGEQREPVDAENLPGPLKALGRRPPCFEQPASAFGNTIYSFLERGEAPELKPPRGIEGTEPAVP